jgi:hypothetical protein
MRFIVLAIVAAILSFTGAASGQTIAQISYAPEFETALEEDYGVREGAYLQETLSRYVSEALAARGVDVSGAQVELVIVDARPNRPTMEQAAHRPGLDTIRSRSIGGAELSGVIRRADGTVLAEAEHRYYSPDLLSATYSADTWGDARRAMRRFAAKLADAAAN